MPLVTSFTDNSRVRTLTTKLQQIQDKVFSEIVSQQGLQSATRSCAVESFS
jgi:hypothetical protein